MGIMSHLEYNATNGGEEKGDQQLGEGDELVAPGVDHPFDEERLELLTIESKPRGFRIGCPEHCNGKGG